MFNNSLRTDPILPITTFLSQFQGEVELNPFTPSNKILTCYSGTAQVVNSKFHFGFVSNAIKAGAMGSQQVEVLISEFLSARRTNRPFLLFGSSAGADLHEGIKGLNKWGELLGLVSEPREFPFIFIPSGSCAGGMAYLGAFADHLILTKGSHLFLTGPAVVKSVLNELVTKDQLGGPEVHVSLSDKTFERLQQSINYGFKLIEDFNNQPRSSGSLTKIEVDSLLDSSKMPPLIKEHFQLIRSENSVIEFANAVNDYLAKRRRYSDINSSADILPLIKAFFDKDTVRFNDYKTMNFILGEGIVDEIQCGFIASQLKYGGWIDAQSADDISTHMAEITKKGLPLLIFLDNAAFLPGSKQESENIIGRGSKIITECRKADKNQVVVIHLGKSYGGGYVAMGCKGLAQNSVHYSLCGVPAKVHGFGKSQVISGQNLFSQDDYAIEVSPKYLLPSVVRTLNSAGY